MKKLLLGLSALLALLLVAPAMEVSGGGKKSDGFVQLFDGKTLKGWKVHPDAPGMWKVEKGAIVGRGAKRSHIFSERGDYKDFHYRVEAKISDKGNSGQYFRAAFGSGWPKGYEAQINSTFPDPQKTGSLYGFVKIKKQLVKPNTWFTQEVIAKDNHIIIKVNGKKVVDFVDKDNTYKKGHFAFQQHPPARGGPPSVVYIRKVEVKEFPSK